MTCLYHMVFDIAQLGLGSITLATSGKTDRTIDLSTLSLADALSPYATSDYDSADSTLFSHYYSTGTQYILGEDPSLNVLGWGSNTQRLRYLKTDLAKVIQGACQTAITAATSWVTPSGFTVGGGVSGFGYTFSYSAAFTIAFSNAKTAAFLGFPNSTTASSTIQTSAYYPLYTIAPRSVTSLATPNYEPDAVGNHVVADDGTGFGMSREVSPLYRDWIQQYETKEKTIRLNAAITHPTTFQEMIEHCRGGFPFLVEGGGFGTGLACEAFSLRSESCKWLPERASIANDAQFHIAFKTVVEGKVLGV